MKRMMARILTISNQNYTNSRYLNINKDGFSATADNKTTIEKSFTELLDFGSRKKGQTMHDVQKNVALAGNLSVSFKPKKKYKK